MRALALDFDGVISQSAREAFVVALRVHTALHPDSPLADLEPDPEQPDAAALYAGFLELMPLGNRAEDFGVALEALAEGVELRDQEAYDAFRGRRDPEALGRFHARFYAERRAWQERDPEGWRELLAPYPEVVGWLRRHAAGVELAIATSKDAGSVHALLGDYGIADLFPAERVLDKETGVSKRAHLTRLLGDLGVAPAELTFVDDKVNHLLDVAPLGVRCALAGWGYNGAREWTEARRAGFRVCTLEEGEAQLFG